MRSVLSRPRRFRRWPIPSACLRFFKPPEQVEIIGIVVNEKGAERAMRTGAVRTLGFPYSMSPQFLRRNQHQTPEEALACAEGIIGARANGNGLRVVAYLSMAFGNPYGDEWSAAAVTEACGQLIDSGVRQISLADTVGWHRRQQIAEIVSVAIAAHREIEFGVHLHARRSEAGRAHSRGISAPVAGGSIQPLAGWEGARSRRIHWWEIFPRKRWLLC